MPAFATIDAGNLEVGATTSAVSQDVSAFGTLHAIREERAAHENDSLWRKLAAQRRDVVSAKVAPIVANRRVRRMTSGWFGDRSSRCSCLLTSQGFHGVNSAGSYSWNQRGYQRYECNRYGSSNEAKNV